MTIILLFKKKIQNVFKGSAIYDFFIFFCLKKNIYNNLPKIQSKSPDFPIN